MSWTDTLDESEAPEKIILQALRESLESNSLARFNQQAVDYLSSANNQTAFHSTPLELVPVLLSADQTITDHPNDVRQTLNLIARYGSAKEVILEVGESLDVLVQSTKYMNDEETEENQTSPPLDRSRVAWKWVCLIDMYTSSFPRLVLRKRSAPETASPVIKHLRDSLDVLDALIDPGTSSQGEEVVDSCMRLGNVLLEWFGAVKADPEQVAQFKVIFQDLLFVSVARCLSDQVVEQNAEALSEQLSLSVLAPNGDIEGLEFPVSYPSKSETMSFAIGQFVVLGLTRPTTDDSTEARNLLGRNWHGASLCLGNPNWRRTAIRWLAAHLSMLGEDQTLDGDIAAGLTTSVSFVAATDSNPQTRAAAFRLLTQLVLKTHSMAAFELVHQMVSPECPFSNLRSSAISILRRLIVRALGQTSPGLDDPFASRLLLEQYSPILFRVHLSNANQPIELSLEIDRMIESLGFYHVLLARDVNNLTGVRDPERIQQTDRELVVPLKTFLEKWQGSVENEIATMALVVSLERVEETVRSFKV